MRKRAVSIISEASMASDVVSKIIYTNAKIVYIQASWTGTPTGAITLEVSADEDNWDTVADSSVSLAGSSGTHSYDLETGSPHVRLRYTRTSGTGTLSAVYWEKN